MALGHTIWITVSCPSCDSSGTTVAVDRGYQFSSDWSVLKPVEGFELDVVRGGDDAPAVRSARCLTCSARAVVAIRTRPVDR